MQCGGEHASIEQPFADFPVSRSRLGPPLDVVWAMACRGC